MGKIIDWLLEKNLLGYEFYFEARDVKTLSDFLKFLDHRWCIFMLNFCYEVKKVEKEDGTVLQIGMAVHMTEEGKKSYPSFHGSRKILHFVKYPFYGGKHEIIVAEVEGAQTSEGQESSRYININLLEE